MPQRHICEILLGCLVCAGAGGITLAQTPVAPNANVSRAHERWLQLGRNLPGSNSAALRQRAIQQRLRMRVAAAVNPASASVTGWTSLGPLPLPSDASGVGLQDYNWVTGRATSIVIDPNDPSGNTVYAGGAYAGVWKSTNAGPASPNPSAVAWTPLTDNQPTLAIGAIAVQPQVSSPDPNASVIVAGTGETDGADSYYGLGILRSADAGQNWTLISQDTTGTHSFAGLGFSSIAFSSTNPNLVVAATAASPQGIVEGLENPVAVNRGIYYSTDGGISWNAASLNDAGVSAASDSVTSVAFNASAGLFYAAVRFHGIYSSSNGSQWSRLPTQPGAGLGAIFCPPQGLSSCPIYRGQISVVSNRPGALNLGEMYVWYVDSSDNDQGIWQSLDGGSSWKAINDSGITNCGDTTGCGTVRGSYNLTLAAVANGMATDLYAGAVNLYKCSINILFPACANTGTNTFMNLTHVYGCSDIAKVHPAQHAIDSRVLNGTLLLYFASDGGIYRALDGYTGVTHGTCGLSNQFDSLNETLGPMTQFVSLAQSSSDPNLIFGGTQNNGTPATAFSQSGGAWINVNAGDSGSSAVNPANDSEWFVATPPDSHSGVNLFRCANGINCHTQDFQSDQIAGSNLVGGDTGPPELPFILDPQNAGTVLLGSCRIWRGTTSGGAFQVLGPNFETAGTGICIGTETNQVRAIAAGGAAGSGGNSQVIYAATNGAGPILQGTPPGGRIWVTTGADGGVLSWADRTGSINPSQFPISAIALDSADPTGNTAYVAIMGFHASHVWKTSDAGVSWTDFNANLPDAPANSIVVDSGTSPSSGTVYVGTDIGVFVSPATNANWTEVGPGAPPGILPNVAVTALKIFSGGGLKRLRAATYGRGIWEFNLNTAPDFQLSITNNPLTVFAGQPSSFDGFVYALNGYRASVDLSCTAGATSPPQSCPVLPSSVFPTPAGTSLAVDPIGTAGDYAFNLHGAGSDAAGVTHDFPLVLHVVDFSLSAPSPAAVNVVPGDTSAPVALTLSGLGSFSGSVVLSCAGLPAGASCQFQPSAIVNPTSGNSVAVNLLVSTSANTPVGTSSVAISALTIGEPAKMQTLAMNVNAAADYLMTIANPSLTGSVNIPATFNGVLTAANGYNNLVNLSCGAGSPANCVAAPGGLAPNSGGVPFAVTVNSAISQAYSFNVIGVGTDGKSISHSFRVDFTALPAQGFDFTMGITPGNGTIQAGKTGLYSLDVAPTSGTFPNNVTVSCSGLPALSSCSFNPTQVAVGSGDSVVTISISSTAAVPSARLLISLMIVGFPLLGVVLATADNSKRRRCLVVSATLFLILLPSCGSGLQGNTHGSGSPGTPPGNYNVVVTAVCGNVTHRAPINLVITQ